MRRHGSLPEARFQMSETTQTSHEPTASEPAHADADHNDHAHPDEALGPVDTAMWGALAVGIAAALLVVLCLVLTLSVIGT